MLIRHKGHHTEASGFSMRFTAKHKRLAVFFILCRLPLCLQMELVALHNHAYHQTKTDDYTQGVP
jgi:hypothetical protein